MTKDYIDFLISTDSVGSEEKVVKFLRGMEINNADLWYGRNDMTILYKENDNEEKYGYEVLLRKMKYLYTEWVQIENMLYILDRQFIPEAQKKIFF